MKKPLALHLSGGEEPAACRSRTTRGASVAGLCLALSLFLRVRDNVKHPGEHHGDRKTQYNENCDHVGHPDGYAERRQENGRALGNACTDNQVSHHCTYDFASPELMEEAAQPEPEFIFRHRSIDDCADETAIQYSF